MLLDVYSGEKLLALPQLKVFGDVFINKMREVMAVFPTKVSSYVIDELIDWSDPIQDPIFRSIFPHPDMLGSLNINEATSSSVIQMLLNPNPSGQEQFIPQLQNGEILKGVQHKYKDTILFFPYNGQTCHSYCMFCFRFSQFTKPIEKTHRFAQKDIDSVINYINKNTGITDMIFTGGDPFVMSIDMLEFYINKLLQANCENLRSIRFGTRALSFFPYLFFDNIDSIKLMRLFEKVSNAGINLSIMAHLAHSNELSTIAFGKAVKNLRSSGATIRSQSPILRNINDSSKAWREKWAAEVSHGIIPYYMFSARDAGAKSYFGVPLYRALEIFRSSYSMVSGLAKTVRGPVMSCSTGKVEILGTSFIDSRKVFILRYIRSIDQSKIGIPFFAEYSETATWISSLKPIVGYEEYFSGAY